MAPDHDYKNYPELTNAQLDEFGFESPHEQITEDFSATVIKVHDGDTITLRVPFRDFDFPLRFSNIDSPELNAGGEIAKEWVKEQIEGQDVEIKINKNNRVEKWGRLLGQVVYGGIDMGEAQLGLGLAVIYGKKSEGEIPNLNKAIPETKWS